MYKILVIDDNVVVRNTIVQILEAEGYEVVSAEDGRRGLSAFRSEKPDLVITDIIMPDMEGLEIIVTLQKSNPQIRIVAVSGSGRLNEVDYLEYAEKLGAYATLTKPFRREELLSIVRRAFNDEPTDGA